MALPSMHMSLINPAARNSAIILIEIDYQLRSDKHYIILILNRQV